MTGKKPFAILIFGLFILTLGCVRHAEQATAKGKPGQSADAKAETAEEKMRRRLQAEGRNPDDYAIRTAPLLGRAMLVGVTTKGVAGDAPEVYLLDRFGSLKPFAFRDLVMAFHDEYPPCATEAEQTRLAGELIRVHDYCTHDPGSKALRSAGEIPGYAKSPLPTDIAGMIRAPWRASNGAKVLYTWRQADGEVRRYSFEFEKNGRLSVDTNCMVLGKRIGDAGLPRM